MEAGASRPEREWMWGALERLADQGYAVVASARAVEPGVTATVHRIGDPGPAHPRPDRAHRGVRMSVLRLALFELRRMTRGRLPRAALAVLTIVPLLQLYLYAFWDALGEVDRSRSRL